MQLNHRKLKYGSKQAKQLVATLLQSKDLEHKIIGQFLCEASQNWLDKRTPEEDCDDLLSRSVEMLKYRCSKFIEDVQTQYKT